VRRRVAILGPAPPDRGGIARETRLLFEELSRSAEVSWWTFSRRYPRWLDPRRFDRDPGLSPAGAEPVLDYRSPLSWKRTAEAIAALGPDAVLVPWWTAFWGLPLRAVLRRLNRIAPETRRVLLCHNVQDHEGGALRRFLALGAFLSADAFVCHSAEDSDRLRRLAPGRAARVLQHPVVVSEPPARERARERLGVEGPLVLILGLIRKYKGVDLLLDAAPEIVRRTGARIAIVGEVFPDAADTMRRVESSPVRDRILVDDRYVSEPDMDLWLAACDAVVLPYRAISGSGIAARAIAAGRPMAAAAVGGLKDAVVPGVTGELFAPGDSAGLAAAVETILARGIGGYAAGLVRAAEDASWPRYAAELLAFVEQLATRGVVGSRETRAAELRRAREAEER
jgi:glycosyltransferase involved in cell wall biosynthesis